MTGFAPIYHRNPEQYKRTKPHQRFFCACRILAGGCWRAKEAHTTTMKIYRELREVFKVAS